MHAEHAIGMFLTCRPYSRVTADGCRYAAVTTITGAVMSPIPFCITRVGEPVGTPDGCDIDFVISEL